MQTHFEVSAPDDLGNIMTNVDIDQNEPFLLYDTVLKTLCNNYPLKQIFYSFKCSMSSAADQLHMWERGEQNYRYYLPFTSNTESVAIDFENIQANQYKSKYNQ